MPGYAYYYVAHPEGGKPVPLAACPHCGNDLTAVGGVSVECVNGFSSWNEESSLAAADGRLADRSGNVAAGLHSATLCGRCRNKLADGPDVVEAEGGCVVSTEQPAVPSPHIGKAMIGRTTISCACPRCGRPEGHARIPFYAFGKPMDQAYGGWTHYAYCPANGEPIFVAVTPDEETGPPPPRPVPESELPGKDRDDAGRVRGGDAATGEAQSPPA